MSRVVILFPATPQEKKGEDEAKNPWCLEADLSGCGDLPPVVGEEALAGCFACHKPVEGVAMCAECIAKIERKGG